MPITGRENEEQSAKLRAKLTTKVYGITEELDELLQVKDDIGFNFTASSGMQGTNGHGNISDIQIRNGRKKEGISSEVNKAMEEFGKKYVHTIPFNDRVRLVREFNFMLTQMPQLYTTLQALTQFIMSPDNYADEPLIQNIFIANNSAVTQSDIEQYLEDKGLYNLIKEGILGSLCMGYRYYEVIPLHDIANKLLDRVKNFNKMAAQNNIRGKIAQGQRMVQSNQLYTASEEVDKDLKEGITLYGEAGKETHIPGDIVKFYRESYASLNDRKGIQDVLYDAVNEALGIGTYSSSYKMYAENYSNLNYEDIPEANRANAIASIFFSDKPYSPNDRDEYALRMHHKLMGTKFNIDKLTKEDKTFIKTKYAESAEDESYKQALKELKKNSKSRRKQKVRDLTGCHVGPLDDEKLFPIIINKEVFGAYVIDTYQDYMLTKTFSANINNVLGSSKFSDQADYKDNPIVRRDIIDGLSNLITSHLDANFVTDNRRLLASIQKMLEENDMYQCQFRIRYIPREYLVPFNTEEAYNGLGKSKLLYARVPIIFWIYLNQNKMMTKLFYEKDKLAIKYRTTFAQSLYNDRTDAMEIFTNLFPLPSELLDFTRVYSAMGTIGRLLIPVDKNGNELFTVDRIEGQKYDNSNDDFMGELEKTIENILGFPLQSLNNAESKYDYATSIIAQDGRLTTMIRGLQQHYSPTASELATKIARYESGTDDVYVEIEFPEPKLLTKSISNDSLTKFQENIDNIIKLYYGEDKQGLPPEKEMFVRRELVSELYPAYDNSEILRKIEDKWKSHKNAFKDNLEDTEE